MQMLESMMEVPRATILELLVAVTGMLGPPEYIRLLPVLWHYCFDGRSKVLAPVCFSFIFGFELAILTRGI